jgi:hypothetical protein
MWKKILWVSLSVLTVVVAAFLLWAAMPSYAMPEALTKMSSDSSVIVQKGEWLVFTPAARQTDSGLIFYPGGKVDYRAYAPLGYDLASKGYLVVIVPMPLNLAFTNINAADAVMKAYPQISHWSIGGHSLGGSMACSYVHSHPGFNGGMLLLGSYCSTSDDISQRSGVYVTSVSGSLDGLSTPVKIEQYKPLLPVDSSFVVIEGGDHAQFGWYGPQSGDKPAIISRAEQQQQVVDASVLLLEKTTRN